MSETRGINAGDGAGDGCCRGAPIGMFDSGVGGLSIFHATTRLLPAESVLYFADTARCPYGGRPAEEVIRFSCEITRFLLRRGCKLIVVACNTATASAIDSLRGRFRDTLFVGIEPAIKPAALASRTGVVGVLATAGTFRGRLFNETSARFAGGVRVLTADCGALVALVESGLAVSPQAETLLRSHLEPMLAAGIDHLVLGCTHFPFSIPVIRRIVGDAVKLVTPGEAVARRIRQLLGERGRLADGATAAAHEFLASGASTVLAEFVAHHAPGSPLIEHVVCEMTE